ncbi:hypothetical protein HNQ34_001967 [Anoxybacillus tepidamans]|uniref:Colicin D immunity protein domain-containing protein n=1 Tax=Anoxybacteroides tepidamans TaxID=265948 RepID=A0A7W8MV36_9BACL|nr:hypothetical protein [Anoxybacillus tepidamans]MBB5324869.1 hypothetical protein [Anoxybacillus tepidamans]
MDELLRCIEEYLTGKLSAEQFSYDFPSIYFQFLEEIIDEQYIDAFDDISEACGWYEPDPIHRIDCDEYIGAEELRKTVEEKYSFIKNFLDVE